MGAVGSKQHARVPKVSKLSDVYDDNENSVATRYDTLVSAFKTQFEGEKPKTIARSPGRVNLIGEHIDYEGYSVLPMAIGLDVIVAVSVALKEEGNVEEDEAEATLSIANVDGEKYTPKEFPFDHEQEVDVKSHHWTNYVLCGFKGIFDQLKKQNKLESVLESAFMKRVK